MIWLITVITFLVTAAVILVAVVAVSSRSTPVSDRLAQLWKGISAAPKKSFREKQAERAQKVLQDMGKLVPGDINKLGRARRMLLRAGFRNPDAVMMFRGAKVACLAAVLSSVYFTGFYRQQPFVIIPVALILGFSLPDMWLSSRVHRRQHRIRLGLPDALDLMVVCVEAGLALDQALLRIAQEIRIVHPELSQELSSVNAEMRVGKTRIEALRELGTRTGVEDIKSLVAMLVQTERFGTSIAQSLRVNSDTLRVKRRQRAEEKAAKAPVKMVPVLVFLIFPALYVVILGPAVIALARHFAP